MTFFLAVLVALAAAGVAAWIGLAKLTDRPAPYRGRHDRRYRPDREVTR